MCDRVFFVLFLNRNVTKKGYRRRELETKDEKKRGRGRERERRDGQKGIKRETWGKKKKDRQIKRKT